MADGRTIPWGYLVEPKPVTDTLFTIKPLFATLIANALRRVNPCLKTPFRKLGTNILMCQMSTYTAHTWVMIRTEATEPTDRIDVGIALQLLIEALRKKYRVPSAGI